jgi:hypothetical protein
MDERPEEQVEVDFRDAGNVESRLTHAFDVSGALERAPTGIDRALALVPAAARGRVEVRARSAAEVGLLLHGLAFARVRNAASAHSFEREEEICLGAGANETKLNDETEPLCRELLARLFPSRQPDNEHADPLFRLHLRSAGWSPGCELAWKSFCLDCAGSFCTRRCRRSPAASAACSIC